jgi:signal transduction histidine kinase
MRSLLDKKIISSISHDLRSPITSNIGLLKLLLKEGSDPLSAKQEKFIRAVIGSMEFELKLIENLVMLFKVSEDSFQVEKKSATVDFLFEKTVERVAHLAEAKDLRIYVDNRSGGHSFLTDKDLFLELLRRIVGNSINFSDKGEKIDIVSYLTKTGDLVIEIADSGCGMSARLVSSIKNGDKIDPSSGTCSEKGTGLGLAICFEICKKLGVDMDIESKPGEGTKVKLRVEN